ncbi:MAG: hypothetical protein AB7K24_20240 [Gemmataceae bacterium]
MRRLPLFGCAFALLALCGCSSNPNDALVREQFAIIQKISKQVEAIKDDASAATAIAQIEKEIQQLDDIKKKMKDMKLPEAEQKRLAEKFRAENETIKLNLAKAMEGVDERAPKQYERLLNLLLGAYAGF